MKERIKNVLNFKKPSRINMIAVVVLVAALTVVLLMTRPADNAPVTYEAREWLDYYLDERLPWDGSLELNLPEYPGATFRWTSNEVTVATSDGEMALLGGMPVWNVYLADLTGDGLPEICATVSFGSGIVDTRILVSDYAGGKLYELSDRMIYDYVLSLEDGRLIVTQSEYNGKKLAAGELKIINGELTAVGIDRTRPVSESIDPLRIGTAQ